jgi:hypothetical protein
VTKDVEETEQKELHYFGKYSILEVFHGIPIIRLLADFQSAPVLGILFAPKKRTKELR